MYQKLKLLLANDLVFTSLLFCGVAIISFLLGQASAEANRTTVPISASDSGVVLTQNPAPLSVDQLSPVETSLQEIPDGAVGQYVASKSGSKYHLVTCPGAKQIKVENKVYFVSATEAEAAGYTKASNCPGL